ncbi:DUF6042 family protein [Kitasatospora sp. NPDC056076]|uniref:DUF6042 family protein n=1 Tax=Kitasatospora sp. NPDC056076 TaxID=3345703 RepID=UPI0035E1301E
MPLTTTPMTDWSDDNLRAQAPRIWEGGWGRFGPSSTALLLSDILGCGIAAPRREELVIVEVSGGWESSCLTDPLDLPEDQRADEEDRNQAFTELLDANRLAPVTTWTELLNLLISAGIIHEVDHEEGSPRLTLADPLPAVYETFTVPADEKAKIVHLQEVGQYEQSTNRVIALFDPENKCLSEITTSLERLARHLEPSTTEWARQTVLSLLRTGSEFTTSIDITGIPSHRVFRIMCDWELFSENRIGIRRATNLTDAE